MDTRHSPPPPPPLQGTNTATLHVSGLMEGKYRVGLTVTDLAGQSNHADIDFTVSSDLYTAGESSDSCMLFRLRFHPPQIFGMNRIMSV